MGSETLQEAGHGPSHSPPAHSCAPIGRNGRPITGLEPRRPIDSAEHHWCGQSYITQPSREYLQHTGIIYSLYLSQRDASLSAKVSAKKIPACPAAPRLPAELNEDAPTYMISSNHGLTANVGYWNSRPLLQLRARAQYRNGAPRTILLTLEFAEVDALERDIGRAEALLNEHNTRTHAGPARLLFRQLSTPNSRRLHHLEVSHWQGYVRAFMRRFFINPQGDLYLTKDGIQYNADQLAILRWLFPLIHREFATAARYADQMGAREQETMDLILAHERKLQAEQARQCDPRLHGRDEADSHADSPRVAGAAPASNGHAETTSPSRLWPPRKEHPCPS